MPSARPLVSRITCPTIGPIALALPSRTRCSGVGVGGERRGDDRCELVAAVHRCEPLGFDDRLRLAAVGDSLSSTCRAAPTLTRLAARSADERGERGGLHA